MRDSRSEEESDSSGAETNGLFNIDRRSIMRAAGGGATAAGLGSLGSAAFSSSVGAQAASDNNSFQIDVIEGTGSDIKTDPTSATNTYAEDGNLIAYQWWNRATKDEGEGSNSRYTPYDGSGGSINTEPTISVNFADNTVTVDVDVSSGSLDIAVVCYSAANGGSTSNPGFDPSGPQREVSQDTATDVSGLNNQFTVDIPQVNNTNQAAGGYTTIQGAVDAASSGDSIEVEPDTYVEDLTLNATNTQDIDIRSTGDHTNTTLDVDGGTLEFGDTTDDNVFDGFTVTDTSGNTDILVDIKSFAINTTVQNCIIDGNGGNANVCVEMNGETNGEQGASLINDSTISNCIVREAANTNIELRAFRGLIADCDINGGSNNTGSGLDLIGDKNTVEGNNDSELGNVEVRRCNFENHDFQSVFSPKNDDNGNAVILGGRDGEGEPIFRKNIIRDGSDTAARFDNFDFFVDMDSNAFEDTNGNRSSDPIGDGRIVVDLDGDDGPGGAGMVVSDATPITDTTEPSSAGSSL